MKLLKSLLILTLLLSSLTLFAGPFVKINGVDARSKYPYIEMKVSVQDKNKNWITGLDEENLIVYEDGYRVNYVQVKSLDQEKDLLYLVFSIDSSKSISQDYFKKIKNAAIDIIVASGVLERIALFRFNDEVVLLKNFTDNKSSLIEKVKDIEQHGSNTLLLDALYDSLDLVTRVEGDRKAVILFTDGKDEGSSVTFDDIVAFANANSIPLFIVTFKKSKNIKVLRRLSKLTGGQCLEIDTIKNVPSAYQKIIRNIKSQYLVRYQTMAKRDGRNHLAEVRLKFDEVRDRDMHKFHLKKEFIEIKIPPFKQFLLALMLFVFTVLFLVLIVLLIKRSRTLKREVKPIKRPFFSKYNQTSSNGNTAYSDNLHQEDLSLVTDSVYDRPIASVSDDDLYSSAWLLLQNGAENKKFVLSRDEVVIGSGESCQIIIRSDGVSKKHCCVKKIDGNYFLFDMVSDTGTILNGTKLLRPKQLYDWDEIITGPIKFIFRGSTF